MRNLAVVLAFLSASIAAAATPPNIVFIMADDLGWQDVGFMGSQFFETPHLDRIAAQSLVLTRSYMYPTCSPSRAALMTGRQSCRTGIYNVPVLERNKPTQNVYSRWTVGAEHPLFSSPLRKKGYRLIHLGKWHIVGPNPIREARSYPFKRKLKQPRTGDSAWVARHQDPAVQAFYPTGRGFHENVGGTWWGDPARGYADGYRSASGGYFAPFKNPYIQPKPDDRWLSDRLTDEALEFISENQHQPFFVNLHFYAPHRPSVARNAERVAHFMRKPADPATGQGAGRRKEIAQYATMVESIDGNVRRIMDHLDRLDLRSNTIVIFTSDNGHNSIQSVNRQLRGAKGTVYEGGIRVPTFVHWPDHIQPGTSATPICGMDFFPTFLDWAGIDDYAQQLDGISLTPLLSGGELQERALFWHLASAYKHPPCSVIRRGPWKLIQFLLDGRRELYHLESDPLESENLIEKRPEIAGRLSGELTQWRINRQAKLPDESVLQN